MNFKWIQSQSAKNVFPIIIVFLQYVTTNNNNVKVYSTYDDNSSEQQHIPKKGERCDGWMHKK